MALTTVDGNSFILGSGELYVGSVTNADTADLTTIESAVVNLGHIESGASVEYKPTFHELKGGNRPGTLMRMITDEAVQFKTGIITWNQDNLSILSNATTTTDATAGTKTTKVGGVRTLPINTLLFVHTKADGNTLKVLIRKAQNTNGFTLTFDNNKETSIDATFAALSCSDGNLLEIIEQI